MVALGAVQASWYNQYKNTQHGDSAHRHHHFHSRVDHCINMAIHHRWTTMNKHVYYGEHSYGGIRMQHGTYNASIYFRRGEDISIEFVPNLLEPQHRWFPEAHPPPGDPPNWTGD
eukprot:5366358-Amphidinium_carterae.1